MLLRRRWAKIRRNQLKQFESTSPTPQLRNHVYTILLLTLSQPDVWAPVEPECMYRYARNRSFKTGGSCCLHSFQRGLPIGLGSTEPPSCTQHLTCKERIKKRQNIKLHKRWKSWRYLSPTSSATASWCAGRLTIFTRSLSKPYFVRGNY